MGGKMAFKYRLHGFVSCLLKEGHSRYLFYRFSIKNSSNVFILWTDPKLKIYQKSVQFFCKEEDIFIENLVVRRNWKDFYHLMTPKRHLITLKRFLTKKIFEKIFYLQKGHIRALSYERPIARTSTYKNAHLRSILLERYKPFEWIF